MSNGDKKTPESEAQRAARGLETARRMYGVAWRRNPVRRFLGNPAGGDIGRGGHESPANISDNNLAANLHAATELSESVKKELDSTVGRKERRRLMDDARREASSRTQRSADDIRKSDI